MFLNDFDFDLPEELIATRPASPRTSARLLVATANKVDDSTVSDLPKYLKPGDRLVFNDTKVIPARLNGVRNRLIDNDKLTSSNIEVTLLSLKKQEIWSALIKPLRKVKIGEKIFFDKNLQAKLTDKIDGQASLRFNIIGSELLKRLEDIGTMPLPPYIATKRRVDRRDNFDYQTVFARKLGSVAAPTASLHFDDALLGEIKNIGVDTSFVTLHVGAGTFSPIRDNIDDHKMHSEFGCISKTDADIINTCKLNGGRVIAVGTTTLRLLESAAVNQNLIGEYNEETDIFIKPGFNFNIVDILLTNFHLPKSSLLLLISAFAGSERVKLAYQEAINNRYRFFSYGDVSLLYKNE